MYVGMGVGVGVAFAFLNGLGDVLGGVQEEFAARSKQEVAMGSLELAAVAVDVARRS
jgi:hypothetical protein